MTGITINTTPLGNEEQLRHFIPRDTTLGERVEVTPLSSSLPSVSDLSQKTDFIVFKFFAFIADLFTYPVRKNREINKLKNLHALFSDTDYFENTANLKKAKRGVQLLAKEIAKASSTLDELLQNVTKITSSRELISLAGDDADRFQANLNALLLPLARRYFRPANNLTDEIAQLNGRIETIDRETAEMTEEARRFGREVAALEHNRNDYSEDDFRKQQIDLRVKIEERVQKRNKLREIRAPLAHRQEALITTRETYHVTPSQSRSERIAIYLEELRARRAE